MKKTLEISKLILIFVLLVWGVSSCLREQEKTHIPDEGERKIVRLYNNEGIYVYDVDGHHYIFNSNGGVIHSETCPCKKQ